MTKCTPLSPLFTNSVTLTKAALAIISSASLCILYTTASIIYKPYRKVARPGKDIEIFALDTARNRRLLYDKLSSDLLSEPWGFKNCHFASLLAQVRPSPSWFRWGSLVRRRIEHIPTPDGGSLEVEHFEPTDLPNPVPSNIPIVLIFHGVNGSSRDVYVEQGALHIAVERGWRAIALNYGHVRVLDENLLAGGNSFFDNGDLNFFISHIRKSHKGFLGCIGYSMGGAKLVQFLGRTGEYCNIDAACAISAPLDFTPRNVTVYNPTTLAHKFYHMGISLYLKLWMIRNYDVLKKHPKISRAKPFRRTKSGFMWWITHNRVTDVDNAIIIPGKGYTNRDQYYNDASSIDQLVNIKIPLLCITAKNDPLVPVDIIPRESDVNNNENIFIINTERIGGHIGFWLPGKGCWATKGCLAFFDSVNNNAKTSQDKPFRQHSIKAAKKLRLTSTTHLNNYMSLLGYNSSDSISNDGKSVSSCQYIWNKDRGYKIRSA